MRFRISKIFNNRREILLFNIFYKHSVNKYTIKVNSKKIVFEKAAVQRLKTPVSLMFFQDSEGTEEEIGT
jgi:hypothetical protein